MNKSSLICPSIIHSAVTFPAPPPLPIPMLLNPQQTKKFLTSGTSPNNVFVSGVKDSGPAKNFLIPTFSKRGTLLNAASKYGLKGKNTYGELQKICTANIKNEIGKTTYTQMLNKDGGIEADLTVVCMDTNYFRIVTSAANREHDKFHILKHLSKEIEFKDATEEIACLGVFGPKSRNLMSKLSNDDFSNENFKFGTGQKITINDKEIWAQRLSYVGELGFELYIKMNEAKEIYNLIVDKGQEFNLSNCGMHAMDTMRMESGFLHWGHDISPEENQYEASLRFAISYKKDANFIGKEALIKIKEKKTNKKVCYACA